MNNYVRFFNADCMGRSCTFYVNGENEQKLSFGEFSRYIKIDGDSATLGIQSNGESTVCSTLVLDFSVCSVYTVAAVCIGGNVCLYAIREILGEPDRSSANLRVCSLSPDVSEDDLYAGRYKIIGDIDYLEVSKYIKMVPDTYDFSVKNNKEIVLGIGKQNLSVGKYNTFYIIGRKNQKPDIRCIVSVDAMSYNGDTL